MRIKGFWWALSITVGLALALATNIRAWDEDPAPSHLKGVINDYTPIAGGTTAWEVRGPWQMKLDKEDNTAVFIASVTMELSPLGQTSTNVGTSALSQHTHDIKMKDAKIILNPTDCPTNATGTPGYTPRFEILGMATVSANGGGFPPPPAAARSPLAAPAFPSAPTSSSTPPTSRGSSSASRFARTCGCRSRPARSKRCAALMSC